MNYIVYKTGINPSDIIRTGFCSDGMIELQAQEGETSIAGVANDDTQYILNGEVTNYTSEQLIAKNTVPYGYIWNISTMSATKKLSDEEIFIYLSTQVRTKRNNLISACDYIMLSDFTITGELLTRWKTYRQELRDVSSQSEFPFNIIWPVKPE